MKRFITLYEVAGIGGILRKYQTTLSREMFIIIPDEISLSSLEHSEFGSYYKAFSSAYTHSHNPLKLLQADSSSSLIPCRLSHSVGQIV